MKETLKTCPNCSACVIVLIFDCVRGKQFCRHCIDRPGSATEPEKLKLTDLDRRFLDTVGIDTTQ